MTPIEEVQSERAIQAVESIYQALVDTGCPAWIAERALIGIGEHHREVRKQERSVQP